MKYYVVEMYAAGSKEWVPVKSLDNIRIGSITFDPSERLSSYEANERFNKLSREYSALNFRITEYEETL
jgi:hypothetical protein